VTKDELTRHLREQSIKDSIRAFELDYGVSPLEPNVVAPPPTKPQVIHNDFGRLTFYDFTKSGKQYVPPFENAPPPCANMEVAQDKALHIDNSQIKTEAIDFPDTFKKQTEEEEQLRLNKGVRKRSDGRYEWRKTVQGTAHQIIHADLKTLNKMIADYKKTKLAPSDSKQKIKRKVIELAWDWFNLHKKDKIKHCAQYISLLKNYIPKLNKDIGKYTKNDILVFLNNIQHPRVRDSAKIMLSSVFAEALEAAVIKRNPIATLKYQSDEKEKGLWYDIEEQKLIYKNRHLSPIGNEIEFYLMTGCRFSEAFNCRLELDKNRIWVERTKKRGTSGYVILSERYTLFLKLNWGKMFKLRRPVYATLFGKLLNQLNIKRQEQEKPIHRLRHTFGTNIYYLGANDKKRAYLMGHSTTKMTNDTYTDFNIEVSEKDVRDIYGDMYPTF